MSLLLVLLLCAIPLAASSNADRLAQAEECFRAGDYTGALQLVRSATHERPDSARAWAVLGASLAKLGHYPEAEQALKRSLHIAPDRPEVLKQLGWLYYETGRRDQAQQVLAKSLRLNASDSEVLFALATVKRASHDYATAAALAQQALTIRPDDLQAMLLVAECLVDLQQFDNAEWSYRNALTANERLRVPSEKPYVLYGQLLLALNRVVEAQRMFTRALGLDRRSVPALLGRARAFEDQQKHEMAQQDAEAAVGLAPENDVGHALLMRIYVATGNDTKARFEAEWLDAKNKQRLTGPSGVETTSGDRRK